MKVKIGKLSHKFSDVYCEENGKTYLYDKTRKLICQLDSKAEKRMEFFRVRWIIAAIAAMVVGFYFSWGYALAVFFTAGIILEVVYRFLFMKNLEGYPYDEPLPAKKKTEDIYLEMDSRKNIYRIIVSLAIVICLIANLFMTVKDFKAAFDISKGYNDLIFILATLFGCGYMLYTFVLSLKVYGKQKKN